MRPELQEALSAFVDGEPVEPALLADAVASEEARDALLDAMLLRARIALETSGDLEALDRRVLRALQVAEATTRRRSRAPLWAAAAVLIAALGIGAAIHLWRRGEQGPNASDAPPPPTRELSFTYGVDWHGQS